MSSAWPTVLAQLVAPAVVVAVSPFSIVATVILLIQSEHPRRNGWAFLAGRILGLAAVTTVFLHIPRLVDELDRPVPPWITIPLGVLSVIAAGWVWLRREHLTEEPAWLRRLSEISVIGSAAAGVFFAVANPKMLAANAAAGLIIGGAAIGTGGDVAAVLYYCCLASVSVFLPVVAYGMVGDRIDERLRQLRRWVARRNAVISAVVLVVVGIGLLTVGLRAG